MGWQGQVTYTSRGRATVAGLSAPAAVTMSGSGTKGVPDFQATFEVRDGRPTCTGVTVTARPTGRGLRTSDLDRFNIDSLVEDVFGFLSAPLRPEGGGFVADWPPNEQETIRAQLAINRARRCPESSITPEELQAVARVHDENNKPGGSPTRAVLEQLGYGSFRTAARRVEQARKAGFLPPTRPGKP